MDNKKQLLAAVIGTAILFGSGGYILGKKLSASPLPQGFARGAMGDRPFGQNGTNRGTGRVNVAPVTAGEVLSKDGVMMTVKLRDGGSRIVFYSTSTGVMRTASGTISDVTVGDQVFITGTQHADGSVTAESVQLRGEGAPMRMPLSE